MPPCGFSAILSRGSGGGATLNKEKATEGSFQLFKAERGERENELGCKACGGGGGADAPGDWVPALTSALRTRRETAGSRDLAINWEMWP